MYFRPRLVLLLLMTFTSGSQQMFEKELLSKENPKYKSVGSQPGLLDLSNQPSHETNKIGPGNLDSNKSLPATSFTGQGIALNFIPCLVILAHLTVGLFVFLLFMRMLGYI